MRLTVWVLLLIWLLFFADFLWCQKYSCNLIIFVHQILSFLFMAAVALCPGIGSAISVTELIDNINVTSKSCLMSRTLSLFIHTLEWVSDYQINVLSRDIDYNDLALIAVRPKRTLLIICVLTASWKRNSSCFYWHVHAQFTSKIYWICVAQCTLAHNFHRLFRCDCCRYYYV